MPKKSVIQRAKKKARQGKALTTQAGEFIREEIKHIRQGKHGARSPKQAIAIGLSKARSVGIKVPGRGLKSTRVSSRKKSASQLKRLRPSLKRSRAILGVLKREPRSSASYRALSGQARKAAQKRGVVARQSAARKAVRTKGPFVRRRAAVKAARTRQRKAA